MNNKTSIGLDLVLKWISFSYGFLVIISFTCNYLYFDMFGILISDYLDLSEIILLNSESFIDYFSNIILGYVLGFIISDAVFFITNRISNIITQLLKLKKPFKFTLFQFFIIIALTIIYFIYNKLSFDDLYSFLFGVLSALVVSRLEGSWRIRQILLISFLIYAYSIVQLNPDSRFKRMHAQDKATKWRNSDNRT